MALLDSLGSLKPMTREEIEREQLRLSGRKREQSQRKIDSVPAGLALLVDALSDAYGGYQAGRAQKDNDAWGAQQLAGMMGGGAPAQPAPAPTGAPAPSGSQDDILARETRNNVPEEIRTGIASSAQALGIDPVDLATAISYETGGTFDPVKAGPTTQWGQHRGLIQFGEPQAKQYGVDWNNPIGSQLGPEGAVVKYLRDRGVKPGMGMMDVYSTINAGAPGLEGRSDANNGGAPGTVADKVNTQMAGHRQKAMALFGGQAAQPGGAGVAPLDPAAAPQQAPAVYQSTRGTDPRLAVEAAGQGMGVPAAPPQAAAGVAQALAQQPAAQQAAPQQSQAQLLALLQSGRLNKRDEGIAKVLLEQQMGQQKAIEAKAREREEFNWRQQQEQAARQSDPAYQADLVVKRQQAADAQSGMTDNMRNLDARAKRAGLEPGSDEYRRFYATGGSAPLVQVGGGTDAQIYGSMQENANAAKSAITGLQSLREAKAAVDGGIISGAGANTVLGLQRVASLFGAGNVDKIVNTETFRSAIAPQVATMVKAISGTTNLSNADREFAEKAAGGNIELNEGSIKRLLGIMERGNLGVIEDYGKKLDAVYPDNGKFARERALFGVRMPEAPQPQVRRYNPQTGRVE